MEKVSEAGEKIYVAGDLSSIERGFGKVSLFREWRFCKDGTDRLRPVGAGERVFASGFFGLGVCVTRAKSLF